MTAVSFSEEDLLRAQYLHARPSPMLWIVIIIIFGVLGLYLTLTGHASVWSIGGAVIGGAIARAVHRFWLIPRITRRAYKNMKTAHPGYDFTWSERDLHWQNEYLDIAINWTAYRKVKEDAATILLYQTDALFSVVPKRWFNSLDELERFRVRSQSIPKA